MNVLSSLTAWSAKDNPKTPDKVVSSEDLVKSEGERENLERISSTESQADVFGKAKAHKATLESAIAQVLKLRDISSGLGWFPCLFDPVLRCLIWVFVFLLSPLKVLGF